MTDVPYLLLISFLTATAGEPRLVGQLQSLSTTPYQGVAVKIVGAYDRGPLPQVEKMLAGYAPAAKPVAVWPWIFFNKFVGYQEGKKALAPAAQKFSDIHGFDLSGSAGAKQQFIADWTTVLRAAAKLQLPGIVVDPELYNNYSLYQLPELAKAEGVSEQQVSALLLEFGRQLGGIAKQECPSCNLFFLNIGYNDPNTTDPTQFKKSRSIAQIILGVAESAKSNVVYEGGVDAVGYCHRDRAGLKQTIDRRNGLYRSLQTKYSNVHLAAPLVVWNKESGKTEWLQRWDECKTSSFKTIADFTEPLDLIWRQNELVWVYAATASDYDPFDPVKAAPLHGMLRQVRSKLLR